MKIISNPPQATVFGRFLLSLQALSREGPVSLVLDRSLKLVRHTVTRRRKRFILLMAGSFLNFPQLLIFSYLSTLAVHNFFSHHLVYKADRFLTFQCQAITSCFLFLPENAGLQYALSGFAGQIMQLLS